MSGYLGVLLSTLLWRTILVGAVIASLKFAVDGAFVAAFGLLVPLLIFAYLMVTDAAILE